MKLNIIPLERFDERLGHAIRLRRSYRRKAWCEVDRLCEGVGLVGAVTAGVIRDPLDRVRSFLLAKESICALEHQIADHLPGDSTGGSNSGHHLAITGVVCEGDTIALTVPAGDLEAVRCPAQVRADRDDLTVVCSTWRLSEIGRAHV